MTEEPTVSDDHTVHSCDHTNQKPEPFRTRPEDYIIPYQGLFNTSVFLVMLYAVQKGVFSFWWIVGYMALTVIPYEVQELREFGLGAYLNALHFERLTKKDTGTIIGGLVLCFSIVIGVGLTGVLASEGGSGSHLLSQTSFNLPLWVGMIAFMYLIVGPLEEYIFRHRFQKFLQNRYESVLLTVVVTNTVFGLLHLPVLVIGGGSLITYVVPLIILALIGSVFSIQYILSDNLAVPALTHGTYNSIVITLVFFSQAGFS